MLNSSRLKLIAFLGVSLFLLTFFYFSIKYKPHIFWTNNQSGNDVEESPAEEAAVAASKNDAFTGAVNTTSRAILATVPSTERSPVRNCSAMRFTTYAELAAIGQPPAPRADGIARYIHQSWKSSTLPPRFASWARSWCECFPEWTHVLWTDADNERLVREHYPQFLERYRSFPREIFRVDAARAMYLHRFGGVFTDLDNVCLRPFEHLLQGHGVVFGDMDSEYGGYHHKPHWLYIQNSFIYSQPGHPFWQDMLEHIQSQSKGHDHWPQDVTGPHMMMNLLKKRWDAYAKTIAVEPPIRCAVSLQNTRYL